MISSQPRAEITQSHLSNCTYITASTVTSLLPDGHDDGADASTLRIEKWHLCPRGSHCDRCRANNPEIQWHK